jgi:hypothetical protein
VFGGIGYRNHQKICVFIYKRTLTQSSSGTFQNQRYASPLTPGAPPMYRPPQLITRPTMRMTLIMRLWTTLITKRWNNPRCLTGRATPPWSHRCPSSLTPSISLHLGSLHPGPGDQRHLCGHQPVPLDSEQPSGPGHPCGSLWLH